ncbi:MAG: terminase small subunit [Oscillospiraceae bacterium]
MHVRVQKRTNSQGIVRGKNDKGFLKGVFQSSLSKKQTKEVDFTEDNEKRELLPQEKLFCECYIELSNILDAGIAAGFSRETAFLEGSKLLSEPEILRYIKKSKRNAARKKAAENALMRMVFGRTNDVVALAFSEETPSAKEIQKMDLFAIAELKIVKGGVEIKLADRIAAAKMLLEMETEKSKTDTSKDFFEALKASGEREKDGA